ncbi:hypothetical protein JTB14_005246 [Gonioctena quinquepunctata]|nr:hypothetical protein JTB14_005246 [Gonioctena quinquepunctata]
MLNKYFEITVWKTKSREESALDFITKHSKDGIILIAELAEYFELQELTGKIAYSKQPTALGVWLHSATLNLA